MRLRPIAFAKLPHVNDVTIKYKMLRLDGFEVAKECFRLAAIGAKVHVRNDNYFYFSLLFTHSIGFNRSKGKNSLLMNDHKKVTAMLSVYKSD